MPFALKNILIPTDLSVASLDAVRYGRSFAERFGAKLTLFYVDPIVYPVEGFGVEGPMYIASTPEHIAQLEAEVHKYADDVLRGMSYDVIAAGGQPVAMIVREAKDTDAGLIIMATHGLTGWRRAILGSVTQGVLHGVDCPVMSVRRTDSHPRGSITVGKIVCPINFTDVARESLSLASQLAKKFDAELLVVHVVEDTNGTGTGEETIRSWIDDSIRRRATYREVVLRGGAAERVLDFAEDAEADLLVIGAQHKVFRDETVIGTTTERLVRFARLPVLTIPRPVAATKKPVRAEEMAAVY